MSDEEEERIIPERPPSVDSLLETMPNRRRGRLENDRLTMDIVHRWYEREESKKVMKEAYKEAILEMFVECKGRVLKIVVVALIGLLVGALLWSMWRH